MGLNEIRLVSVNVKGEMTDEKGNILNPPAGWAFLKAGDAGVTRRVTSKGVYWKVQLRKGRRLISKGVWAPAGIIAEAESEMQAVRDTYAYKTRIQTARKYREKKQSEYEGDFLKEVESFLNFAAGYKEYAHKMAKLITDHATPVGSGTVARTKMIPIEERASRAVIAWMRHQTTAYDTMDIARIKGERRKVRSMLARRSVELLEAYRKGEDIPSGCPLMKALNK